MNVALRRVRSQDSPPASCPSPLEVLELRAWARSYLWQVGEFDLHEAVDELQRSAEEAGLVAELGQDRIQQIMADAFAVDAFKKVRP
jgi:hypothetical protein